MPRTPGRLCCEKLREAAVRLLERGLSVEEVASLLGVSERSVRRWAAGKAAAAVDKAAVVVEKSANMQKAAERPGAPPVDNVWVAILRKRQLGTAGGAADINTQ